MKKYKLIMCQTELRLPLVFLIFLVLGIRIAYAFNVEWISPSKLEYGYNYITIKVENNANYQIGTSVYVFSEVGGVRMVDSYKYVIFGPYEKKYLSYKVFVDQNVKEAKFIVMISDYYSKEFKIPSVYKQKGEIKLDAWPSSSVVRQGDILTIYVKVVNNGNSKVKGKLVIEAWDEIERRISIDANSYKTENFDIEVPTYFSGVKIINVSLIVDNQKIASKSLSVVVQKSAELEIVEIDVPKFVKVNEPFSISIKYRLNTPTVVYLRLYLAKSGQEFTLWKDYAENGYTGINTYTFKDLTIDKEGEYKIKVEAIAEFDMDSKLYEIYVGKLNEIKLSEIELSPQKVDNSRPYLVTVKFKIYSPEKGEVDVSIRVDGKIVKSFDYYVSEGVNTVESYISTGDYPINKKPGKYAIDVYAVFNNKYAVSEPVLLEIYEVYENKTEIKKIDEKKEKIEVIDFNAIVFPKKIDITRGSGTSGYILIENKAKSRVEFVIKTDTSWVYVNKKYVPIGPGESKRIYFYISPPQAFGIHKVSFFVYPKDNPDLVERLEISVYASNYIKTGEIKPKKIELNVKILACVLVSLLLIILLASMLRKEEEGIV